VTDAQLTEHLHARGFNPDPIDVAMIREGAAALQAATGDCDQAFEEQYKCSARDPSNAGDLAIWRAAWAAKGADALAAIKAARVQALEMLALLQETLQPGAYGMGSTLAERIEAIVLKVSDAE
jgi:hypothetical protein